MESNKLGTIHRLHGDIKSIDAKFDLIESLGEDKDEEILYYLRHIVDRCNYISNEIERNFK